MINSIWSCTHYDINECLAMENNGLAHKLCHRGSLSSVDVILLKFHDDAASERLRDATVCTHINRITDMTPSQIHTMLNNEHSCPLPQSMDRNIKIWVMQIDGDGHCSYAILGIALDIWNGSADKYYLELHIHIIVCTC